jgi:nucleolar protein 58
LAFKKFKDTTEALVAATALLESSLDKGLKKFLKKNAVELQDKLAVSDAKLGGVIKEELGIKAVNNDMVMELMRGVRSQMSSLIPQLEEKQMNAMALGLAHTLSRYKLKFSSDKVDTMIVQAIGLLDTLDKEINTYAMRVKEWYGWHFPEMQKIVIENVQYAQCVMKMGMRGHAHTLDFSDILTEDIEEELKETAKISMGTDISEDDLINIKALGDQVISLTEYRAQLFDYLKNRMQAIAPNLTVMVGELVGARLIAHSGSLLNLAKCPASTVQILGAEKALFRALKTKHETPKYGLIYHASLIGQAAPKHKGKISRVLAAKCALSIRVDALGESSEATIGYEAREKVEARLRQLEGGSAAVASGNGAARSKTEKYVSPSKSATPAYNAAADNTAVSKKRKVEEVEAAEEAEEEKPAKKSKKEKKEKKEKKAKKSNDDEDDE